MTAIPVVVFAEDYTVDITVGGRVVTLNVSITDGNISVLPVDSDVTVIVKPVEPSEIQYNEKAVVLSPANLRSGPGVTYAVVGGARKGEVLDLAAKTSDGTWYKTVGGGWIYADLVQIAHNGGAAPTMTPMPTGTAVVQDGGPAPTNLPIIRNDVNPTATPIPTQVPPQATSTPVFVAPCGCEGNQYNCGNFSTHSEAQACFDYCVSTGAGDIHGLDADDDGLACEALP